MISVILYTKNEACNVLACLQTVGWCSDVHVLDSGSADDTVRIARAAGAHVYTRPFDEEDTQKNWAIRHIPFMHPWIFQIDCDERCTAQLARSMLDAVRYPGPHVGFRFRRRDFYQGKWIRHTQSQAFSLRLFRRDSIHYERVINAVPRLDGPVKTIAGYLDHYPFSKGHSQWIERHNWYSSLEAHQILRDRSHNKRYSVRAALTATDFHDRRYHQKGLFYRIPLRPFIKFVYLYGVRGGFLDGGPGFRYAVLQSMYEYWIALKTAELERSAVSSAETHADRSASCT